MAMDRCRVREAVQKRSTAGVRKLSALLDSFAEDRWRLYGCIRLVLLLAAGACLIVGLDEITTWLLK